MWLKFVVGFWARRDGEMVFILDVVGGLFDSRGFFFVGVIFFSEMRGLVLDVILIGFSRCVN